MTNVPEEIRDMWKDVYVFFDSHYLMPNTIVSWSEFWKQAGQIVGKYKENYHVWDFILTVSDIISDKMKAANAEKGG